MRKDRASYGLSPEADDDDEILVYTTLFATSVCNSRYLDSRHFVQHFVAFIAIRITPDHIIIDRSFLCKNRLHFEENNRQDRHSSAVNEHEMPVQSLMEFKWELFSVDEIPDSEMVFGEMEPSTCHRLSDIRLKVEQNLGKYSTGLVQARVEPMPERNSGLGRKRLSRLSYAGGRHEMSPGSSTESYPTFAHIGLRENPGKTLNQVTCPDRELNLGQLVSRSENRYSTRVDTSDEEAKQNYQVEISNRFATLESSDEVEKELDVNSVWENIRDSIKIAAEQSIGYYETKKKKPWFDEDCCMVVERRKQAKLTFLQDPVEEQRDNYFNERRKQVVHLGIKREIMEKKWEYKGTVHQLFIDFKKAYDSVKREVLYDILIEFGIPKKLVRLIKMCLMKHTAESVQPSGFEQTEVVGSLLELSPQCVRNRTAPLQDADSLLSKNLKVRIYKTVILPVVLYGCEPWTLTFREEHRLRVFENKVLRKIFGAKSDEITGELRKLHNTELHSLYSLPDIIRNIKSRRLRWAGHVARMGESRNAYRVLVGRPAGKRPLGRPRRRWEDNIKMDLREVGCDDREWINLGQDREQRRTYVRAAMNLQVP
ncbi:hypothetical protein ANN_16968 [Periplaneta americana]|uniref:Reverse transcriptase domain-containing protein n=1 Tax=Periplaneta americana TaxID=6978 RepID=A0ABQ8SST4_PERAM|nr:hypothetical protein ANN_16968 [Periplaneta americana]